MLLTMTRIKVVSELMISDCLGSGTVEVGWVGLSWEWILVWECMRIRIDQPRVRKRLSLQANAKF